MPALPALPVPAWNTQATYSSIYTPGIHAIDPHSSIAMSIHKRVEKVGFGPFALAPAMPTGLTGGAFPGLFRVGTDEMRPLNALRGISRLFTKRPEAIAPTGGPWLHNWAPQSPLGALLLPLVWVLGYIQSAFRNPSHLLLLVLWYAVYTTSTGGTGALIQALTVCFLCAAPRNSARNSARTFGVIFSRPACSRRPPDTSCSRTSMSGGPPGSPSHSSCGHS